MIISAEAAKHDVSNVDTMALLYVDKEKIVQMACEKFLMDFSNCPGAHNIIKIIYPEFYRDFNFMVWTNDKNLKFDLKPSGITKFTWNSLTELQKQDIHSETGYMIIIGSFSC